MEDNQAARDQISGLDAVASGPPDGDEPIAVSRLNLKRVPETDSSTGEPPEGAPPTTQPELLLPIAGGRATSVAAANAAPRARDFITVLTAKGRCLTKKIWRGDDGKSWWHRDYDSPMYFDFETKPVAGLEDIKRVLDEVGTESCLILGRLKDGVDPNGALRRLNDRKLVDGKSEPATVEDTAHYWLPIDIDSLDPCDEDGEFKPIADPARTVRCLLQRLLPEFQAADCVWQFTSSAGFKPGIRMRLYFWLSRPLTGAEMKTWLGSCDVVDPSIYVPTQPIYAAPPVIEGIRDPVPQRSGILYQSGPVITPEAITPNPSKKTKGRPNVPVDMTERAARTFPGRAVQGPTDVEFDEPETVGWAIEVMRGDLAAHGVPEIGKGSDNHTYALIGTLRDGPAWGKSLKPETIAGLLKEHWAPHFDLAWLKMKANGTFRNDPGVGSAGAGRLFGAEADEYPGGPLDVVLGDPFAEVVVPDTSGSGEGASAPPSPSRPPPLQLGSDVDIAKRVAQLLHQQHGEVLFEEGHFWFYDTTHWRPIRDDELRRTVHTYDGAAISGTREVVRLGNA